MAATRDDYVPAAGQHWLLPFYDPLLTASIAGAGRLTKAVSSMVLHHVPHETQVRTIAAMRDALRPGGAIRIADFVTGHFASVGTDLVGDLTVSGFVNARVLQRFRILGSASVLVAAEKP